MTQRDVVLKTQVIAISSARHNPTSARHNPSSLNLSRIASCLPKIPNSEAAVPMPPLLPVRLSQTEEQAATKIPNSEAAVPMQLLPVRLSQIQLTF